jgi:glycerol-3-phosphate acyltransferase PlsY
MNTLIWTLIAFIAGSLPFSVWVGRLALRTDIRRYGDHNPGATNVGRAGGWQWGALALLLDMLKGALPVGLAWYWGGLAGWALLPVALAPVLGHGYSPFLGFRGGKALGRVGRGMGRPHCRRSPAGAGGPAPHLVRAAGG